jgi:hypothetical protein
MSTKCCIFVVNIQAHIIVFALKPHLGQRKKKSTRQTCTHNLRIGGLKDGGTLRLLMLYPLGYGRILRRARSFSQLQEIGKRAKLGEGSGLGKGVSLVKMRK